MPLFPDTNALGALEWNPAELELKEKKREREKEKEKWKIILQIYQLYCGFYYSQIMGLLAESFPQKSYIL